MSKVGTLYTSFIEAFRIRFADKYNSKQELEKKGQKSWLDIKKNDNAYDEIQRKISIWKSESRIRKEKSSIMFLFKPNDLQSVSSKNETSEKRDEETKEKPKEQVPDCEQPETQQRKRKKHKTSSRSVNV